MSISFIHVNLVSENWRELADFYIEVFGCIPVQPERNLFGKWLDDLTALEDAHIKGIHLRLPGCGDTGPTIEIFEYDEMFANSFKQTNTCGFAHIAFSVDDIGTYLNKILVITSYSIHYTKLYENCEPGGAGFRC